MSSKAWREAHKDVSARHSRAYYARNKDACKAAALERKRRAARWLKELKSRLSCVRCREAHPACLQFHHRNPSDKKADLSTATREGWTIKRIEAEIVKCDVLCANCHLKEHYAGLYTEYLWPHS